jgi:hypothetical protein
MHPDNQNIVVAYLLVLESVVGRRLDLLLGILRRIVRLPTDDEVLIQIVVGINE